MTYTTAPYFGKVCSIHPELMGLRTKFRRCGSCEQDRQRERINTWKYNPEYRARQVEYRKTVRPVLTANVMKYRPAKECRVPSWANHEKIKAFYMEAERTGMTVDHIIPLRGQLVSGLHVENNLQLLPGSVNYSKGNSFKVE